MNTFAIGSLPVHFSVAKLFTFRWQYTARKLGLQEDVMPDYFLLDVKDEFDKAVCPINLDALLEQENPVWYLVETEKISDYGLETFIEILFHSDLDEDRKAAVLHDALAYLDGKGFFSFKLHALSNS